MEHSTIGLTFFILAVALFAITHLYCVCRVFRNKRSPLHQQQFASPTPPAPWNTRAEQDLTGNNDPWYLVVYADVNERNYTVVAAEDILDFQFSGKRGEMRIHCKKYNGFPDNTMNFENIHHYEFQQASQLGDFCLEGKE